MYNTNLPTNLTAGSTGHINHANTVHASVNESSRSTEPRDISGFLQNGWELGNLPNAGIHIQRIRDMVYLYVRGLSGANATDEYFIHFGQTANPGVISTAFIPSMMSYRSSLHMTNDIDEPFWWIEATGVGIRVPDNYKRPLGSFGRVFTWPAHYPTVWPANLPPKF